MFACTLVHVSVRQTPSEVLVACFSRPPVHTHTISERTAFITWLLSCVVPRPAVGIEMQSQRKTGAVRHRSQPVTEVGLKTPITPFRSLQSACKPLTYYPDQVCQRRIYQLPPSRTSNWEPDREQVHSEQSRPEPRFGRSSAKHGTNVCSAIE